MNKGLSRIIDANFNRAKEGLRVCEDISRYIWNQKALTGSFKKLRHQLTDVVGAIHESPLLKLLQGRQAQEDVGRPSTKSEFKRKDIPAVFLANAQRVKESLRVLEETIKLLNPLVAEEIKTLRYRMYVLEQKAATKV